MAREIKQEPWDRMKTEGPVAYGQFLAYLQLPPEERSYQAAWQKWTAKNRPDAKNANGVAPGWWRNIAYKNDWQNRADLHDSYQNRRVEEKLVNRRVRAQAETAELGEQLRKKAAEALKILALSTETVGEIDGKEVILISQRLTPNEIAKMAQVGVELEQLALGGPTERTEVNGKLEVAAGGPSLANAKEEIGKKLEEMKHRYEDVQRRLATMGAEQEALEQPARPILLPPSTDSAA